MPSIRPLGLSLDALAQSFRCGQEQPENLRTAVSRQQTALHLGKRAAPWARECAGPPRSPATAVRLGLNAGSRGELVGDGAGVAWHGGRGGVDLVDEQGQGAGDAGGTGLFEPDGDGVGGSGDGAGQATDDGLAGDGAVFVVVAQVGVEVG